MPAEQYMLFHIYTNIFSDNTYFKNQEFKSDYFEFEDRTSHFVQREEV